MPPEVNGPVPGTRDTFITDIGQLLERLRAEGVTERMEVRIEASNGALFPHLPPTEVAVLYVWTAQGVQGMAFTPDTVRDAHVKRIAASIRGRLHEPLDQPLNAAAWADFQRGLRT